MPSHTEAERKKNKPLKTFIVDGKPIRAKTAAEARAKRKPKAKKKSKR